MNKKHFARRAVTTMITASFIAAMTASLIQPASAHRPSANPTPGLTINQVVNGNEVKRTANTGIGMPSIMGPFDDTLNMEWLGQVVSRELGADRLIQTGTAFLSDIWGWTSPGKKRGQGGHEYAIVGHSFGIGIVRVTDPANPVYLGTLPTINTGTQRNWWWDIKTYGNYVYFVSEVSGTGVGIFDMSVLDAMNSAPESGLLEVNERYLGNGLVAAHNISINEDTGFAYLTGTTKNTDIDTSFVANGMVILDLKADPLNPVEVGQILGRDTHDAQIVSYAGPDTDYARKGKSKKEIAFVFNGTDHTVGIYDVTEKQVINVVDDDSITISETTYTGASFTHQGWVTEDQHFLVMGDEEDELFGISDPQNEALPDTARTYVWNIQDLDDPGVVSTFDSPAASIDHNLFIKNGENGREIVYQANYTAGIRVTELTREGTAGSRQVANLEEVAHMDTEPRIPNKSMNFNFNIWVGTWGVYPFLDSGTIMASDGLNGLVLMKLDLPK
jgi:choice-of-anchor B domain-containing protein